MHVIILVCLVLIAYIVGSIFIDFFSKYLSIRTPSDAHKLLIFSTVIISICVSFPFYLFKYNKMLSDTLALSIAIAFVYYVLSHVILIDYIRYGLAKPSANYTKYYHTVMMFMFAILTVLI